MLPRVVNIQASRLHLISQFTSTRFYYEAWSYWLFISWVCSVRVSLFVLRTAILSALFAVHRHLLNRNCDKSANNTQRNSCQPVCDFQWVHIPITTLYPYLPISFCALYTNRKQKNHWIQKLNKLSRHPSQPNMSMSTSVLHNLHRLTFCIVRTLSFDKKSCESNRHKKYTNETIGAREQKRWLKQWTMGWHRIGISFLFSLIVMWWLEFFRFFNIDFQFNSLGSIRSPHSYQLSGICFLSTAVTNPHNILAAWHSAHKHNEFMHKSTYFFWSWDAVPPNLCPEKKPFDVFFAPCGLWMMIAHWRWPRTHTQYVYIWMTFAYFFLAAVFSLSHSLSLSLCFRSLQFSFSLCFSVFVWQFSINWLLLLLPLRLLIRNECYCVFFCCRCRCCRWAAIFFQFLFILSPDMQCFESRTHTRQLVLCDTTRYSDIGCYRCRFHKHTHTSRCELTWKLQKPNEPNDGGADTATHIRTHTLMGICQIHSQSCTHTSAPIPTSVANCYTHTYSETLYIRKASRKQNPEHTNTNNKEQQQHQRTNERLTCLVAVTEFYFIFQLPCWLRVFLSINRVVLC